MSNIQKASNLDLIMELMFDGECRMVKSLVDDELIDTRLIWELLASRAGRLPINKLEYWYEWFIDEATFEKTSDKNLLIRLHDFKCNYVKPMWNIKNNFFEASYCLWLVQSSHSHFSDSGTRTRCFQEFNLFCCRYPTQNSISMRITTKSPDNIPAHDFIL